jgi:mono/diheme cytochrome c family protein
MRLLFIGSLLLAAPLLAQQPIGQTSATEVQVSGAVNISHGETTLGNGSEITAGKQAVKITLQRGGELRLCSTSSVHLSKDRSIDDPANSALMIALNRGALEANYSVGKYSDVLLTPDLRILISGPGHRQSRSQCALCHGEQ